MKLSKFPSLVCIVGVRNVSAGQECGNDYFKNSSPFVQAWLDLFLLKQLLISSQTTSYGCDAVVSSLYKSC